MPIELKNLISITHNNKEVANIKDSNNNIIYLRPNRIADNTSALVKTMPSGTIGLNVNKIYGASEVSENLAVFDDLAETTINGVKVKYQDGAIYLDGTANAQFKIAVQLKQPIYANQNYYVKLFTNGTTTATNPKVIGETSSDDRLLIPSTTTFNVAYNINYFWFSVGNGTVWTNYVVKPMIVKGTTEPSVFVKGFANIHNLELTGLKVEGANLANNPTIKNNASSNYTIVIAINNLSLKANQTYTISFISNNTLASNTRFYIQQTNVAYIDTTAVSTKTNYSITFTPSADGDFINIRVNNITTGNTGTITNVMLNRGSTALAYVPYIQPTTLPIDLTSIEDSGGNKLFADGSLKGYGGVFDSITPYKATKNKLFITLNKTDYTWTANSNNTLYYCDYNFGIKDEHITGTSDGDITNNILCDKLEARSINSILNGTYTSGICINNANASTFYRKIAISASDYTNLTTLNVVVDLKTPIEADIDLSQLKNIQGYSKGSITAQNTYDMAVHSEILYYARQF